MLLLPDDPRLERAGHHELLRDAPDRRHREHLRRPQRRADVLDSIGTPARPMDAEALKDKIAGLLAPLDAVPGIGDITRAVEDLEQKGAPERLVSLFAKGERKAA